MMTNATNDTPAPKWRKIVVMALSGAVVGFLGAFTIGETIEQGVLGDIDAAREIAALVGMVYVVTALAVGIGLLSPKLGARFLNVEDAGELVEMKRMLTFSTLGMLCIGAVPIVLAFAAPAGGIAQPVALVLTIGLIALAAFSTVLTQRHSDELMRQAGHETGALSFYMVTLLVGGWMMLAHLKLVDPPQMIAMIAAIWAILLASTFWVCGRRGMLTSR